MILQLSPKQIQALKILITGKEYNVIIAALLEEYEVGETVLRRDVDEFLEKLKKEGLLSD